MTFKSLSAFVLLALFSHHANATVSLDIQTGALRTSGGAIVPTNTTMILVADINGFSSLTDLANELMNVNLVAGSTIGSGGKILQVVAGSDIDGNGNIGYVGGGTFDLTALGLNGAAGTAGTDLAVLWFPGLLGDGAATVGAGQSFGFYRSDSIDSASGGSFSFNMPTDPSAVNIWALDPNIGGGIPTSNFEATGTVGAVPEPSRVAFLFLGMTCLVFRRKRN